MTRIKPIMCVATCAALIVLSATPISEAWGFDLLLMNIGDEDGVNARFTDVFGVGATGNELVPPRQILGRVRFQF